MKTHKYNAKAVTLDGERFDSTGESRRWRELKLLERAKKIRNLERQVAYELQPKYKRGEKTIRAIKYEADFRYEENGRLVVEDFKGMETPVFKLKAKLFGFIYPDIELRITR